MARNLGWIIEQSELSFEKSRGSKQLVSWKCGEILSKYCLERNFFEKPGISSKFVCISFAEYCIYGKVTMIKSLLIPKLVYVSSLLPTPSNIKQVNHVIFSFLWKGEDKTTRLSAINTFEEGSVKMIDIESMIKALRLAWLKRMFNNNDSAWKFCLIHLLKQLGDILIFECDYAIKDLPTMSAFYRELLLWWSEFRDHFFEEKYWLSIIWNNKNFRIDGNLFFTKRISTPESALLMICF